MRPIAAGAVFRLKFAAPPRMIGPRFAYLAFSLAYTGECVVVLIPITYQSILKLSYPTTLQA